MHVSMIKLFSMRNGLTILILLYLYTTAEQLSKLLVDGESQIYECQSENLQIQKRRRLEQSM